MSRARLHGIAFFVALALSLITLPASIGAHDDPAAPRVTQANGVTREVLSTRSPAGAPGKDLLLLRFIFEPGAVIPPHTHPGMQTVSVVSGTLGYTVFCCYAAVTRAGTTQSERLNPGPETFFKAGDAFTEVDGLLHAGRNAGSGPLVLLVASLLRDDMPLASPPPRNRSRAASRAIAEARRALMSPHG